MKKLSLSLLLLSIAFTAPAQETDHLTVAGVPIDGSEGEFVAEMLKRGYEFEERSYDETILSGYFGGYANSEIHIFHYPEQDGSRRVYKAMVGLPACSSWKQISRQYLSLKEMLAKEFGPPSSCVEKFKSAVQPQDDNAGFHELLLGNGLFGFDFVLKQGRIQGLIFSEFDKARVVITYEDAVNNARRQVAFLDPDDI